MRIRTKFQLNTGGSNEVRPSDYISLACLSVGILLGYSPMLRSSEVLGNVLTTLYSSLLVGFSIYMIYVFICAIIAIDNHKSFIWETPVFSIKAIPPENSTQED